MAYVESEYVMIYVAQCDDCGWICDDDYWDRSHAEAVALEHEENCPERHEDADPRTDREKYQDTLDALVKSAAIHNV